MKRTTLGLIGLSGLFIIGAPIAAASATSTKQCAGIDATITKPAGYMDNGTPIYRGTEYEDVIVASRKTDVIYGFQGNDLICGLGGDDSIFAGDGDDTVYSGKGNDIVQGGTGHDTLEGGQGRDALKGGAGHDLLRGGPGDDNLAGGPGRDGVNGQQGWDSVSGGKGADSCLGEKLALCSESEVLSAHVTRSPDTTEPQRIYVDTSQMAPAPAFYGNDLASRREATLAIVAHYFPAHQIENAQRVLECENARYEPRIEGLLNAPEDGIDYGIFQINDVAQGDEIAKAVSRMSARSQQVYAEHGLVGALKDAAFNIEYAFHITQNETWRAEALRDYPEPWRYTRWGAWSCGKKTDYWLY